MTGWLPTENWCGGGLSAGSINSVMQTSVQTTLTSAPPPRPDCVRALCAVRVLQRIMSPSAAATWEHSPPPTPTLFIRS
jgi:hypothetical protein